MTHSTRLKLEGEKAEICNIFTRILCAFKVHRLLSGKALATHNKFETEESGTKLEVTIYDVLANGRARPQRA